MTYRPAQGVGDLCGKHNMLRIPPILGMDNRVNERFSKCHRAQGEVRV